MKGNLIITFNWSSYH